MKCLLLLKQFFQRSPAAPDRHEPPQIDAKNIVILQRQQRTVTQAEVLAATVLLGATRG